MAMLDQARPQSPSPDAQNCRLLCLPVELQLAIFEMAVISDQPLLLNCPCDSSYEEKPKQYRFDIKLWKRGVLTPPSQPPITQTCHAIRDLALPIFYQQNVFRATYCYPQSMLKRPTRWLKQIGPKNREMIRHFYFFDRNPCNDDDDPDNIPSLLRSEICTTLGGELETLSSDDCCAHLVSFGYRKRRENEIPLASELGVPRLKLCDEG